MTESKWTNSIGGYTYRISCDKCGKTYPEEFHHRPYAHQEVLRAGWLMTYKPGLADYIHLCTECRKEVDRK